MIDTIDAWLRLAASRIHEAAPTLTALDQAIGDGDHGTNMDRGFAAIMASLDGGRPEGDGRVAVAAARIHAAGRTLISTVGGAAGPLYGTAFLRAGGALAAASDGATSTSVLLDALEAASRRDPGAREEHDRREDDARRARPRVSAGRERAATGGDAASVTAAIAEAAAAGATSHDPDGRDQGSRVLPRRAVRRASGSWRDVIRAAAPGAG